RARRVGGPPLVGARRGMGRGRCDHGGRRIGGERAAARRSERGLPGRGERAALPRRGDATCMTTPRGYFCLVLHAHLPFVRHPEDPTVMEERWLYEAI